MCRCLFSFNRQDFKDFKRGGKPNAFREFVQVHWNTLVEGEKLKSVAAGSGASTWMQVDCTACICNAVVLFVALSVVFVCL